MQNPLVRHHGPREAAIAEEFGDRTILWLGQGCDSIPLTDGGGPMLAAARYDATFDGFTVRRYCQLRDIMADFADAPELHSEPYTPREDGPLTLIDGTITRWFYEAAEFADFCAAHPEIFKLKPLSERCREIAPACAMMCSDIYVLSGKASVLGATSDGRVTRETVESPDTMLLTTGVIVAAAEAPLLSRISAGIKSFFK